MAPNLKSTYKEFIKSLINEILTLTVRIELRILWNLSSFFINYTNLYWQPNEKLLQDKSYAIKIVLQSYAVVALSSRLKSLRGNSGYCPKSKQMSASSWQNAALEKRMRFFFLHCYTYYSSFKIRRFFCNETSILYSNF